MITLVERHGIGIIPTQLIMMESHQKLRHQEDMHGSHLRLPEKTEKEIELADGSKWVYPESQGVVSLQTTRDTGYQSYIMVQNELTRAFNEVRDEVAMKKFGAKFSELSEDQRNAVSKAVPLKISEAEPRNIKK